MIELTRDILRLAFDVWSFLLLAWVVLSWLPNIDRGHPAVQTIERVIEPTIRPFRRLLPNLGPFDISPLIAIAVFQVAYRVIDRMLYQAAGGF